MGYDAFEKLCAANGVTPYRVSKETGVSTSTFSSWKTGRYVPKAEKLQKIADYFGVSVEYFTSPNTIPVEGYYVYGETAEVANEILKNADMRYLFDAAKGSDPEALKMAAAMLKKMKRTGE